MGIEALKGKFAGDVTNVEPKVPTKFIKGIRGALTPKQWQKERRRLLKLKLP